MRSLCKSKLTGNDLLPVDTINSNLIQADRLPLLPNPKKKELVDVRGKRFVSYQLRYLYLALEKWTAERPGYRLSFVTVHFSQKQETRLKKARKGPVAAFADQLQKRLEAMERPVNFFMVLEEGKSDKKSLHAHIVISHWGDDLVVINRLLRRYASPVPSGIDIKDYYLLKLAPKRDTFEAAAIEMDIEYGDSGYTPVPNRPGKYYRKMPMNIGVADYMSKQVENNRDVFKSAPFYAPQSLRRAANALYEEAYRKQQTLRDEGIL
jgi:hypothetical protein